MSILHETPLRMSGLGRAFAASAVIEAITWAGLLVGMVLKYVTETTEAGVWLFGRLHGAAFVVYLVLAVAAAWRLRWSLWVLLLALLSAIPPFATIPMEIWLRRTGRLSGPAGRRSGGL